MVHAPARFILNSFLRQFSRIALGVCGVAMWPNGITTLSPLASVLDPPSAIAGLGAAYVRDARLQNLADQRGAVAHLSWRELARAPPRRSKAVQGRQSRPKAVPGGPGRLALLRDGALLKLAQPSRDLPKARIKRVSSRPVWDLLGQSSRSVRHTVVRSHRANSWRDAPLAASRAHASCTSDHVISAVSAQRRRALVRSSHARIEPEVRLRGNQGRRGR